MIYYAIKNKNGEYKIHKGYGYSDLNKFTRLYKTIEKAKLYAKLDDIIVPIELKEVE